MMRLRLFGWLILAGAGALMASGCGDNGGAGAKVTGSVTKSGAALEAVSVNFIAKTPGDSKGARTDAAGKFEVRLKPGNYTVTLVKMVDKKGNAPKDSENPTEDIGQLEASGYLKNALPAKLADPGSSPFKVDIPAEGKELAPFDVK